MLEKVMKNKEGNFKGFGYYGLQQDDDENIILHDYNDVVNARRARMDMLLDNIDKQDADFIKVDNALSEKLVGDRKFFIEEDEKVAQDKKKVFRVLDNLDDLSDIDTQDLLTVSLLFSDLSYIEKNIVLSNDQDSDLAKLRDLFLEKKESGEYYTDNEYGDYIDYIEKINNIIKLELNNRIENKDFSKHQRVTE
ncbi:MAG: hypothetical protein QWI36_02830 [Wolbachia endosymbiont of Tyrophagus putrescentiae]|nr:hypothetical protein [Wolbachia endosymbiont of Tyrophagus putrescentiae]